MSAGQNVQVLKTTLRKDVRHALKALAVADVEQKSRQVCAAVADHEVYRRATNVSIFVSMPPPREVQTWELIRQCFQDHKRVYVPKVTGASSKDMVMVPVPELRDIEGWPWSKWSIKEPTDEYVEAHPCATDKGEIDLVIVPGLAFSPSKSRLGQGKGYYDTFLKRLFDAREEKQLGPPVLVGVGLDEQIVEEVPVEGHDYVLDYVITPTRAW
jgi:5-formyltetrahydrofolate cyclo-ligase